MSGSDPNNERRVTLARRIGMGFFTLLSAWIIIALTIGVVRGIGEYESATVIAPEAPDAAEPESASPGSLPTDR